ncbi:16215_t:CDS:2 [Rhizophagus irregularis]|nr:16215_t:CDS:2 [Rhizophagus irregularis]
MGHRPSKISKLSKLSSKLKKKPSMNNSSSRDNNTSNSLSGFENFNEPIFKFENGRRYINNDSIQYLLPNDDDESPCMKILVEGFIQFCKTKNMNPIVCPLIPGYLQENGFVDIDTLKNSGHYGSSAGRFGKLALEDFILVFDALKTPISSILEINNEEYQNLLDKLQEEVDTNDTFYEVYKFIGKKFIPEN